MNIRFKSITWLFLLLFVSSVSAKSVKFLNEEQLSVQISAMAKGVRAQAKVFTNKVGSLPNDQGALELFYDDILAYVEKLQARVGPDTDLARSVSKLKTDARSEYDDWLKLCTKTRKSEDCHYSKLWEKESGAFSRDEAAFLSMVNEVKRTRELFIDRRKYIVADLKLNLFDNAIVKLGHTFERIKALANTMDKLAVEVGDKKFVLAVEE